MTTPTNSHKAWTDKGGHVTCAGGRSPAQSSSKQLKELSGLSFPTAAKAIENLVELGIAREITGGRRNRLFAYDAYLAILSEGTEPL